VAYQLVINEKAQEEFETAVAWYEQQQKNLGERFINIIQAKLELIAIYPERYPKRKNNFREAPVRIFPFIIVYTIYKKDKIISVSSIFHTSRNPQRKYRKK
jgi:plasmid stabilization system protein ParE